MNQEKPAVIVTGSSGLIGTRVLKELQDRYELYAMDRRPLDDPEARATVVAMDLSQTESVNQGMEKVRSQGVERIAAVIHLAAFYDFSGEENPLYEEVTVKGTKRLLDALEPFDVERFIFSSTMLVHAPAEPGQRIDEHTPIAPKWPYPESKAQTEEVLLEPAQQIPVAILRIAGVYTDQCDSIPLAHQIQRIYEKRLTSRLWPGDKDAGQSYVHLDDLARAIAAAVDRRSELPPQAKILVGEEWTLSYDRLQHELGLLIHDKEWTTAEVPKVLAKPGAWLRERIPGDDPFIKPWMVDIADDNYDLDISRAKELLHWQPEHNLESTLPKMVAALKRDPEGWYEHHGLGEPSG